jgi:hypothetical protein
LKDLLGAGEADIIDACAELGCGSVFGVVPMFSKRGGLTAHAKNRNAGIGACAILRAKWNLRPDGAEDKTHPKYSELDEFRAKIRMSQTSGRLVWNCENWEAQNKLAVMVQETLLRSWRPQSSSWDSQLFQSFDDCEEPSIQNANGMVELHWLAPDMPLETNTTIVLLFIAFYTIVPTAIIVIAATPLLGWQTPAASALLWGGQAILSIGHFLAPLIIKRQRTSVHVDVTRDDFSSSWMLVDNTWFTGTLARRRVHHNPISPHTLRLGQHALMKSEYIPTWEALLTLLTIAIGFLAFYIGARSSSLYVILSEIVSTSGLDLILNKFS